MWQIKLILCGDDTVLNEVKELAKKENLEIYQISGATGEGVKELIDHVAKTLQQLPKEELVQNE